MPSDHKKTLRIVGVAALVMIAIVAVVVLMGGDKGIDPSLPVAAAPPVDSFTFLKVGAGTRFSSSLRSSLSDYLGSDGIERKGTVDLLTQPRDLLYTRFPTLHALHRDLNNDQGARVEHHITRLTYRYPGRQNTWFKYVELVFSNYTARPLYFRITLNKEGTATLETIRQKYGDPKTVASSLGTDAVLYWEKSGDFLIVSRMKDRFGDPEYHVMFYFVANLQHLLDVERKEIEIKEKKLKQAGKTAF
jgi:hypothetical protein